MKARFHLLQFVFVCFVTRCKVKPCKTEVVQTNEPVSGENVTLECRSCGVRPESIVTWVYKEQNHLLEINSTTDPDQKSYSVVSKFSFPVNKSDDGLLVMCHVNDVSSSLKINVHYLVVRATNITTHSDYTAVTCKPQNFNGNYTRKHWQQIRTGYGKIRDGPLTNVWKLKNPTYEYSGVYICTVKATDDSAINVIGNTSLVVKSPPIILKPKMTQSRHKIGGRLEDNTTISLWYYSNVPNSSVYCYHSNKGTRLSTPIGTVNQSDVMVQLPVFSNVVPSQGTKAIITIMIKSEDDFGDYDIVISNGIGSGSVLRLNIFQQADESSSHLMLIVGIAGTATCIIILAVIVVTRIGIKRRKSSNADLELQQTNRRTDSGTSSYNYVTENAMYISGDDVEQPAIASAQSDSAEIATNPNDLYAVPDKTKKAATNPNDIYAVPDKTKMADQAFATEFTT